MVKIEVASNSIIIKVKLSKVKSNKCLGLLFYFEYDFEALGLNWSVRAI